MEGDTPRAKDFHPDDHIKQKHFQVDNSYYKEPQAYYKLQLNRGHMAAAGNYSGSEAAKFETVQSMSCSSPMLTLSLRTAPITEAYGILSKDTLENLPPIKTANPLKSSADLFTLRTAPSPSIQKIKMPRHLLPP